MNSSQVLFLFPDDTDDARSRVRPRIEALGLHAGTLFDVLRHVVLHPSWER